MTSSSTLKKAKGNVTGSCLPIVIVYTRYRERAIQLDTERLSLYISAVYVHFVTHRLRAIFQGFAEDLYHFLLSGCLSICVKIRLVNMPRNGIDII